MGDGGDARARLDRLAGALLDAGGGGGDASAAAAELHAFLAEVSGLDPGAPEHQAETVLPSGIALAPMEAAACVTDHPRTARFAAGVEAAVHVARDRFPGRRLEVVYAGCGPFATLLLPLTARFTPDEVGFTLLDLHAPSLELARRVFDALGLGAYVREWVQCDATTYRHPEGRELHVAVSETMRKGLASEPQVAVTLNLRRQLTPGGTLVPERISVGAYLANLDDEELFCTEDLRPAPERGRHRGVIELGPVFEVSLSMPEPNAAGAFPPVNLEVPPEVAEPRYLVLSTRIAVSGPIHLDDHDSGLTYPMVLRPLGRLAGGMRVELRYVLGREPRFHYRFLGAGSARAGTT